MMESFIACYCVFSILINSRYTLHKYTNKMKEEKKLFLFSLFYTRRRQLFLANEDPNEKKYKNKMKNHEMKKQKGEREQSDGRMKEWREKKKYKVPSLI